MVNFDGALFRLVKEKTQIFPFYLGKNPIFPSACFSFRPPLLFIQNTSLLMLLVTKCMGVFPIASNYLLTLSTWK